MDTPLTPREKEILQHLFTGKSNKEIASSLGLTEGSIKNYLRSAYDKLGVHQVRELFPLVIAGQRELMNEQGKAVLGVFGKILRQCSEIPRSTVPISGMEQPA